VDKDQLIKRLMKTFLEELEEHVGALNRDLLALEKDPSALDRAERLKTLFRTAHSLKGAARSVNATLIESVCHRLEEILSGIRDGKSRFTRELFVLLFAATDAIEEAGMRLREQQDLAGAPLAALLPRLDAAASSGNPETKEEEVQEAREHETEGATGKEQETTGVPVSPPGSLDASPSTTLVPLFRPSSSVGGEASPEPAGAAGAVRVSANKLDAFLARSGELLVARRRVQSRAEELTTLREFVGRWKAEWRAVEKPVAKFLLEQGTESRPGWGAGTAVGERLPRRVSVALARVYGNLCQMDKDLERLAGAVAADGRVLKEAASSIDDEVRRVRMLPFAEACQGLDRMVRDLARAVGKEVELVIEGGDVELDRSVLEGLKDPLRHLVRNAVDHGAETPEERRASGKSPHLRLTVAAAVRGAQVEVVVADDGRGINLDALRAQVRKKGLPEPADAHELAQAIFLPGFSTSKFITDVSGRGVGLDVVKSRVEALHGDVELSFAPGSGTHSVPLTLTTLRVLLVAAGGQTFALSAANVQKLVRAEPDQLRSVEGRQMLALGARPVPLASLAETLGLRGPAAPAGKTPVVVLSIGEKRMAFVVEEFQAELEVVIKSLGTRVRRTRFVSAATILPSGKIALVLNAANVVRRALQKPAGQVLASSDRKPKASKKRILVVDDSLTTRALEKSILEAAGYDVTAVADGAVAWQTLQERGADLVVSDVDMPRMDGFALTEAVRGSERFRDLPVVLVTARETEADRTRGVEVRADAYLGKSAFDQKNLLETIAQLL
jgi:two-component system, chemotaxis family, sensor kinase CheA